MLTEHLLHVRHHPKSFKDHVPAAALQMVVGSTERVVAQITQGPGWARKSFQKEVLKDKSVKEEREGTTCTWGTELRKNRPCSRHCMSFDNKSASCAMTLPGDWVAEKITTTRVNRRYLGILSGKQNYIDLFEVITQSSLNLGINTLS